MKSKVYIIGAIPSVMDDECQKKFYQTHLDLMEMGYRVINPLDRLMDKDMTPETAKKKNLHDLMMADAVYILPDVPLGKNVTNIEVKLAMDFNLTIILGKLDLADKNTKSTFEETQFNQSLICV